MLIELYTCAQTANVPTSSLETFWEFTRGENVSFSKHQNVPEPFENSWNVNFPLVRFFDLSSCSVNTVEHTQTQRPFNPCGKQHLRYLHTPDWERDLTKRHEYSLSHMHVIFVNHSPSKTDVRPPNRNERSLTRLA